ncbi:hypothetical protein PLESTB_000100200 [Pleodorina starrii]|uniref:Uncharacterized protein n=1 Tax=Pleodorina starrii TaxID=330485 RepID=A0A9W6BA88_9CHLO|nr:hypothetical protein PLESTM_000096700 [Pleodorina starrii]GLC48459.1 hypothetical protein PLESTB_000100200 [Pleodorina starrii]GLC71779.1 hypothetical protein PLESTF_001166000 [Pleodorina starrii]
MATLRMSAPSAVAMRSGLRSAKPVLPVRKSVRALAVRAQASQEQDAAFKFGTVATLSTVASSWMMAGNANAATELATLAANDNRLGIIATLFVPALGWVAFNIFGSLQAQLDQMSAKNGPTKKRAVPAAIGLGAAATLLAAQSAEASTELATLAANDNRLGIIATLFVPALGWVAFNIFGSLQAQLDQMSAKNGPAKRAVPAAIGLGAAATLLAAQSAEASTELATLAANDNRLGIIATLFVPALGWVAFNIFGSLQAQLDQMSAKNGPTKKRAVPAAIGLGAAATLLAAQSAEASTELATLAANDNRLGIIATLFVPALGWVAFNIFGSLQAQLDQMSAKNGPTKKRAVPAAIGLGAAATLLAAQSAEASTELATLAANDNRLGIIATLFVPALGWVAFNIFGSLQAQLDQMSAKNK